MLVVRKEAKEEIKAAFTWYEKQRTDLGAMFLLEVERVLDAVQSSPDAYEVVYKNFRRALCRKFPYAIYFLKDKSNIAVMAVLHQRRHPSMWQQRK